MRLERRRWTGSRLVNRGVADRRHPRRPRPRLRADRVRARPAAVRQHGRRGRARAGAGPRVAQRQAVGAHARAVPRAGPRGSRQVVARGLRNSQGFDWQPGTRHTRRQPITGRAASTGRRATTRSTRSSPAATTAGRRSIGDDTGGGRFTAPLRVYRDAIAPSGATFVSRRGSRWTGDFLLAALRGTQLRRLVLRDGRVVADRPLLAGTVRAPAHGRRRPGRLPLRAHQQPRRPRLPDRDRRPHPAGTSSRRPALPASLSSRAVSRGRRSAGAEAAFRAAPRHLRRRPPLPRSALPRGRGRTVVRASVGDPPAGAH